MVEKIVRNGNVSNVSLMGIVKLYSFPTMTGL